MDKSVIKHLYSTYTNSLISRLIEIGAQGIRMSLPSTSKNQNQKIDQKAMEAAAVYEKKRTQKDPIVIKKKVGYDLESGDRKIEVKGTKLLWKDFQSSYQVVTDNERKNATHIYQYCDVLGTPDLHIFEMSKVHKALHPEVMYRLEYSQCREDESEETRAPKRK